MLEGDRSDHLLLVRDGRLKIVRTNDDGRESLVAVRGPNELVGELNALCGSEAPRAASVVALDDVTVQSITANQFLDFVAARPTACMQLLRSLALRLRESTLRHAEAAGYDSLHRVARMLVELADSTGRTVDGSLVVAEGLSHGELGGLVAASPKSVARALATLRTRGLVTTARRAIVIDDLDRLRQFAG
jgi:CRP-like cAMP-binding protein